MSALTRFLAVAFGAALFGLAGCSPPAQDAVDPGNSPGAEPPPSASPAPEGPALTGKVPIVIETSMGTIEAELDADKAPITVTNFVAYANKGFYDNTVFHRVISDFMIQGGGFTEDLKEKPNDAPIQNEGQNGLHNEKGTLAMARTGDPNSATSQFFINVEDNTQKLDYPNPDGFGYAVFGKVTKGMDVVDKIKAVRTTNKQLTQIAPGGQEMQLPADDVPVETVLIKSIKVVEAAGAPESGGPVAPAGDAEKPNTPGPGGH